MPTLTVTATANIVVTGKHSTFIKNYSVAKPQTTMNILSKRTQALSIFKQCSTALPTSYQKIYIRKSGCIGFTKESVGSNLTKNINIYLRQTGTVSSVKNTSITKPLSLFNVISKSTLLKLPTSCKEIIIPKLSTGIPIIAFNTKPFSDSISISSQDMDTPYVNSISPTDGSFLINPMTTISIDIRDNCSGLTDNSLNIWINDINIVSSGTDTATLNGYTVINKINTRNTVVTYTPIIPLPDGKNIIRTVVSDRVIPTPYSIDDIKSFRVWGASDLNCSIVGEHDTQTPYITDISPLPFSSNIPLNMPIKFNINDDATGVHGLNIRVNGTVVIQNNEPTTPNVSIVDTGRKVEFTYTPNNLRFGQSILVEIEAQDLNPNVFSYSYLLDIVNFDSLHVSDFSLDQGESKDIGDNITISASIIDNIYNVRPETCFIEVDGILAQSWTEPILGGYKIYTTIPYDNISPRKLVIIHAENDFNETYPIYIEEPFVLVFGKRLTSIESVGKIVRKGEYAPLMAVAANNTDKPKETAYTCIIPLEMPRSDLKAYAEARVVKHNLIATASSIDITHWRGKVMEIELYCEDFSGNPTTLKFQYRVED